MIPSILKQKILKEGPLRLDHFINIALYHPDYGYYRTTHPVGRKGDFITSPEICSLFGELIGLFFLDYWEQSGMPTTIILIEIGPGKGTLTRDILCAFKRRPQIFKHLTVHLVETSESLTKLQKKLLQDFPFVYWHTSLNSVPEGFSLIVGNEFFDALSIRQFCFRNNWVEKFITIKDNQFCFIENKTIPPFPLPNKGTSLITEISEDSLSYADLIGKRIAKNNGIALIIDYGTEKTPWQGDSLQAIQQHRYVNVLESPGQADITHHVDFFSLKKQFQQHNLTTFGTITQSQFLKNLGIELRAQQMTKYLTPEDYKNLQLSIFRLISPEFMGQLFKVLVIVKNANLTPAGFNGPSS